MPSVGKVEFLSVKTFIQFRSEQDHWLSEQLILHTIKSLFPFDKIYSVADYRRL